MGSTDEDAVRHTVTRFCQAIQQWEATMALIDRVAEGKRVTEAQRDSVAGLTYDTQFVEHARIFEEFIVPRERKYGSNPGRPKFWRNSFAGATEEKILSVNFTKARHA